MRSFTTSLSWLWAVGALCLAGCAACAAAPPGLEAGPFLQPLPDNAMAVLWVTRAPAKAWVTLEGVAGEPQYLPASEHGLVSTHTCVHKVIVYGLEPGRNYTYQIHWDQRGQAEPASEGPFSFRLPAAGAPVTIVAFSDIHNNTSMLERLAGHAGLEDTDLIVLVGDMVDHIFNERIIQRDVLAPMTTLTGSGKPIVWARGNHETRGVSAHKMQDYLAMPDGRYYYAFGFGPAFIIVLDSGEDKEDSHPEYMGLADFESYRQREGQWLARTLASAEAREVPLRLVFTHFIPPSWKPILKEGGVDLVVGGHYHEGRIYSAEETGLGCPHAQCGGRREDTGAAVRMRLETDKFTVQVMDVAGTILKESTFPGHGAPAER